MSISVFDLFTIGIGPSSSHTVGPMRAAAQFLSQLEERGQFATVVRVKVEMFGSLGLTGKAHGSEKAVLCGLEGDTPHGIDVESIELRLNDIRKQNILNLGGKKPIAFHEKNDLVFHRRRVLPAHPNGMLFQAFDNTDEILHAYEVYSIGGGFVVSADEVDKKNVLDQHRKVPHVYQTAADLLQLCKDKALSIPQLIRDNERTWRSDAEIDRDLLEIWNAMKDCVTRGLKRQGELPGGLHVKRRAYESHQKLLQQTHSDDPLAAMDWVNLFALAVSEENAAGGRVVTSPTNGAAGIIPAVLHYYDRYYPAANASKVIDFLLTAGAVGILYKQNASISGAEVGCQGEVGVACSMAAGGLAQVLGGSNEQVENAAEIAMEHNLGLTCDPVGGLVQIPCIERNAMGSVKAINAARMALGGDGTHKISLDKVIRTMRQTGKDMQSKYKETSRGGLAVDISIVEC